MSIVHEPVKSPPGSRDETTLLYGALDYFQVHFIIMGSVTNASDLIAKCRANTKGLFSNKRIVKIDWEGGKIADILRDDPKLDSLLRKVLLKEGEIYIDPLDDHVRVYGKWKHEQDLTLDEDLTQAMDTISYHVRAFMTRHEHAANSVTEDSTPKISQRQTPV
jgi:hypothetical protein